MKKIQYLLLVIGMIDVIVTLDIIVEEQMSILEHEPISEIQASTLMHSDKMF